MAHFSSPLRSYGKKRKLSKPLQSFHALFQGFHADSLPGRRVICSFANKKQIMCRSCCKWVCTICVLFFAAISSEIASASSSNDRVVVNVTGKDILLPVTLETSKGSFSIYGQFVYDGWLQIYGATDSSGRKVNVSHVSSEHRNGGVVATYNLTWVYGSNDDSGYADPAGDGSYYYEDDGGYVSGSQTLDGTVSSVTKRAVDTFMDAAGRGMGIDVQGYPYGALSVGMSRFYGEFARFSVKFGGMGGFNMFGGVGKDWVFGLGNSDKLAWHVGIGAYFSFGGWADECNQAVSLNVSVGETPVVVNKGMACEIVYEYFLGDSQRFGLFGGLGFVLGNFKATEPEYDWDFQVGVAFKLWAN